MFFSIIIPIYNAEEYIEICLDAIVKQSFKDWELILINDGSTDGSLRLMEKYEGPNIRIIEEENKGVSFARNRGLDIAKGKYVIFIDSDDILYTNALQILYSQLKCESIDYLRYEYQIVDENGLPLYPNYEARKRKRYEGKQLNNVDCINRIIRNEYFLWSGVFKKKIMDKFDIRFLEGCTYNEDTLFIIQYLMHSSTHMYISNVLYGYRKSNNAVTTRFTEKNRQDIRTVIDELCKMYGFVKDKKIKKELKSVIETLYLRIMFYSNDRDSEKNILVFCCTNPNLLEFKLIKFISFTIAKKLFPFINIIKKIIRKLY